eukprot:PhM_4_TR16149/c6_g3_i2/m.20947
MSDFARERLTAFYNHYNPADVHKVDGLVNSGKDDEVILKALFGKYQVPDSQQGYWLNWSPGAPPLSRAPSRQASQAGSKPMTPRAGSRQQTEGPLPQHSLEKLTAFYNYYNPADLHKVEGLANSGRSEDVILSALFGKYQVPEPQQGYWLNWTPSAPPLSRTPSRQQMSSSKPMTPVQSSRGPSRQQQQEPAFVHEKLTAFYMTYNPADVHKVDGLVNSGKDDEVILKALFGKYTVPEEHQGYWLTWTPNSIPPPSLSRLRSRTASRAGSRAPSKPPTPSIVPSELPQEHVDPTQEVTRQPSQTAAQEVTRQPSQTAAQEVTRQE